MFFVRRLRGSSQRLRRGKKKNSGLLYCRVGDAEEEPFRLAALGTFSQGISDLHDFIEDRYEIGALLTLAGTAL